MAESPVRPTLNTSHDPYVALRDHPDVARLLAATPSRLARGINAACDPTHSVTLALLVVSLAATPRWWVGIGWAALTWAFCVGLPLAWLVLQARRGRVVDRHLVVREQRRAPLLVALGCMLTGLALAALLGAPREVVAFVVAVVAAVLAMTIVSQWHKASFHVGALAASAVAICQVVGWRWAGVAAVLLALCGWARVRTGRHTALQVLVGLVVSATVTATVEGLALTILP